MRRLRAARWALLALPGLAVAVSLVGLGRLEWVDDIRALNGSGRAPAFEGLPSFVPGKRPDVP